MKLLTTLAFTVLTATLATAATGPIRVLHLGKDGTDSAKHAHSIMRDLGRDAIWFDYTSDPSIVTPEWIAKFDAVLLDAPKDDFKALSAADAKRVVTGEFTGGEKTWAEGLRAKLLTAVGDARKKDWEAFLAQREPEKREPNPNVANYERRPEAITFVEPLSVKGSMERTQVPADCELKLFASRAGHRQAHRLRVG
jgi:hypothetical protein